MEESGCNYGWKISLESTRIYRKIASVLLYSITLAQRVTSVN